MTKRRPAVRRSSVPPYKPQLATLVRNPPDGDEWLHEMEYDGYRVGCRIVDGAVTLISGDGKDCTEAFPEIRQAAEKLAVRDALVDGAVAVVLPDGRTSLQDLQMAATSGSRRGLVYFAFDLLHAGGETLLSRPLDERKAALLRLVGKPGARSRIRYSEHVTGRGAQMVAEACRLRVEGIVSKQREAKYTAGRGETWVKTKCVQPAERRRAPPQAAQTDSRSLARASTSGQRISVAGVGISHPGRVMFPQPPITKLEIARFYERIADWIVPHLQGRPLTLVRCPEGITGDCLYMKHSKVWAPPALRRASIQEKTKLGEYLIADSLAAIVSLVQMDVLEFHTWNTRIDDVERPDRIVFDIDPGARVPWSRVIEGARLMRKMLRTIGLESFPKTTGGNGIHVVVPLVPRADWRECLDFSRALAEAIERHDPAGFTTAFAKAGREEKILIDYLRNNRTNTSVAAFSIRAREGAPLSMPLRWEEVTPALDPNAWTIVSAERRLSGLRRDPWRDYWTTRQRLPKDAVTALGSLR